MPYRISSNSSRFRYLWASTTKAKYPLILIANFIFEYLAIHLFQDGNGRTSRLLTNLMFYNKDTYLLKLFRMNALSNQ